MFWSFDLDDFTGKYCGEGVYPLLTAMAGGLVTTNTHGNGGTVDNTRPDGQVTLKPQTPRHPHKKGEFEILYYKNGVNVSQKNNVLIYLIYFVFFMFLI